MTGSIGNKQSYKTKRGYYLSHDYDEKLGGEFDFLLEPLVLNEEEGFFYVRKQNDGKFEVTGEGYICTSKEALNNSLKKLQKKLSNKTIWYFHIDDKGQVIRKEEGKGKNDE